MAIQTFPQFSLVFSPADLCCQESYMLSVPRHLHNAVVAYLRRQGCKFQGRWSQQRNRSEFYIQVIQPKTLLALAERIIANRGVVSLLQDINPPTW